jgi:hypothetical protein
MLKFYRKILNLLPILFLVVGINYYEDPAQLYRQKYEQGIADLLLSGKNVAGVKNFNQRILQKYLIQQLTSSKDIVVLGSSRSMLIPSEWFPGHTFFNNSVTGGSIQDYVAMYELYEEQGLTPKIVIICLDPWVLNKENGQNRWQSLNSEYDRGMNRIGIPQQDAELPTLSFDKYIELFSPSYFQASLLQYLKNIRNPDSMGYYPTVDMYGEDSIIRSDGSLAYPEETRSATSDAVLEKAKYFVSKDPVYALDNFEQLDKEYETTIQAFIKYLVLKNIKVILYLPPYHPYVYGQLMDTEKYQIILDAQEYLIKMGLDGGAVVVGSYNPTDVSCSADEFYDGMHAKEACVKKVFSKSGLISNN